MASANLVYDNIKNQDENSKSKKNIKTVLTIIHLKNEIQI